MIVESWTLNQGLELCLSLIKDLWEINIMYYVKNTSSTQLRQVAYSCSNTVK